MISPFFFEFDYSTDVLTFFLTIKCRIRDNIAPAHITPNIGQGVSLCSRLTTADASAPIAICIHPNKAEALPARDLNGVNATADVLGKINPCPKRKKKIRMSVTGKVNVLVKSATIINTPINACQVLAS